MVQEYPVSHGVLFFCHKIKVGSPRAQKQFVLIVCHSARCVSLKKTRISRRPLILLAEFACMTQFWDGRVSHYTKLALSVILLRSYAYN